MCIRDRLIKYPQTFDPCCRPFYRGKMSQILAQLSTPIVFGPPYFWTAPLYRKSKTNLAGIYDRPLPYKVQCWTNHHTKHGVALSPNSENHWRNGYPKRVKVENFLHILRSSSPRRVQRRQCHITCWGRCSCKKTTTTTTTKTIYKSAIGRIKTRIRALKLTTVP